MRSSPLFGVALAIFCAAEGVAAPSGDPGSAYGGAEGALEARVWIDRGMDPVLHPGEAVRVYYRSNADAHAAIFHIDTNGFVRLLFPSGPGEPNRLRAGRDYRLLFPGDTRWVVDDLPGVGYFFLVASPVPFDFSPLGYSSFRGGWDLSGVGTRIDRDPHLAIGSVLEALLPEAGREAYALDFTAYHVGQSYLYPRFLCYECHGYRPLVSWNPYHSTCLNFRVVVYSDPYFYPATRYRGTRVVFTRPTAPDRAQFAFRARAPGEPGTPLVQTRPEGGGERAVPPAPFRGVQDELRSRPVLERRVLPVPPPLPGGRRPPGG